MRICLFLLVIISVFSCKTEKKPLDCSRFKNGKFLLKDKRTRTNYIISRSDSSQAELNENTDTLASFAIKWLNDCEYELVKRSIMKFAVNDPAADIPVIEFRNEKPLNVKIIATGKNYYVFSLWKEEVSFSYSDTMWVIDNVGGFRAIGDIYHAK